MLAGAGILSLKNIYVQQMPVNAPYCCVDNSQFWCQVSSVVNKQFLFKLRVCRPNSYWLILESHYHVLKETNFKIVLTMHLPSGELA